MARPALGKGLRALMMKKGDDEESSSPEKREDVENQEERILTVDMDELHTSPFQPRRHFAPEQIAELAASIKERGLLQPLVARISEGRYEIIAGERRLRAARSIGMKKIRIILHEATDLEVAELTLIENLQREGLTPLEEAEQYQMLQKRFGLKQGEIARHVGKTRSVIANMIRLLDLDEDVRNLLNEQKITVGHAKVLLQLKDPELQVRAANRVVDRALTVRMTEHLVKEMTNPTPRLPRIAPELPEGYAEIREKLSNDLGTAVHFNIKSENRGSIEIPYLNKTELTRILQIFGISSDL